MNKTVPAGNGKSEYIEKRSRFLGVVEHINSEEEARNVIASVKKEHYDARHNCWCYIIDGGPERYSDDGEPQGTAGIPMLEIFKREGVSDVVCVVTRYFGGVLLGAGGLFRAYSKAAKDALEAAGIEEIVEKLSFSFNCPYPMYEQIKKKIDAFGAEIIDTQYGAEIEITVSVIAERAEELAAKIFDFSNGKICIDLNISKN